MKKVVIIASSRVEESRVFKIADELMLNRSNVDYVVIDPISFRMHPFQGTSEDKRLTCKLIEKRISDDTKQIKEHLLTSDLILVISPVSNGNINSYIKSMLSKLSDWLKLFKLAQKPILLVTTSDTENSEHVLDNLEITFNAFGAAVLLKSDFYIKLPNEIYGDKIKIINELMDEVLSVESLSFKPNKTQEGLYSTYKEMISSYPKDDVEYKYWKKSGLLSCSSLTEYYDKLVCEGYF